MLKSTTITTRKFYVFAVGPVMYFQLSYRRPCSSDEHGQGQCLDLRIYFTLPPSQPREGRSWKGPERPPFPGPKRAPGTIVSRRAMLGIRNIKPHAKGGLVLLKQAPLKAGVWLESGDDSRLDKPQCTRLPHPCSNRLDWRIVLSSYLLMLIDNQLKIGLVNMNWVGRTKGADPSWKDWKDSPIFKYRLFILPTRTGKRLTHWSEAFFTSKNETLIAV